jgi:hypothetical protein
LLNCWIFALVLIGMGEQVQLQRLVERSAGIAIGATEGDVERAIGEPGLKGEARRGLARFIFGERRVQWIYGTSINLGAIFIPELPFLNPIPLRLRLFSADEDDLVIEWTPTKQVAKVSRPKLDVPDELMELYQPIRRLTLPHPPDLIILIRHSHASEQSYVPPFVWPAPAGGWLRDPHGSGAFAVRQHGNRHPGTVEFR